MDKTVATNVEKATTIERLQVITEWKRVAVEWEKELQEEISCAKAKLESTGVELGSAQ